MHIFHSAFPQLFYFVLEGISHVLYKEAKYCPQVKCNQSSICLCATLLKLLLCFKSKCLKEEDEDKKKKVVVVVVVVGEAGKKRRRSGERQMLTKSKIFTIIPLQERFGKPS